MRLTGKLGIAATVLVVAAGALLLPVRATAQTAAAKSSKPPAKASAKAAPKAGATTKPVISKASTSKKRKPAKRRTTARRQTVPTNDRIREIQAALIGKGHLSGEAGGKWDARSVEALKQFQAANSLRPTGKIDAASLQKLGLGSQTAGLAAPRPPATAESGSSQR